jgi:carbonic anhydrase
LEEVLMMIGFVRTCLVVVLMKQAMASTAEGSPEWNYEADSVYGPSHWSENYAACGKELQSPIDITPDAIRQNKNLGDFAFTNYEQTPASFLLHNNGHSVQVDMPDNSIKMAGADLFATFTLSQFHFHWGPDDTTGSEHTINGQSYPLEIHLVHWNSDQYTSFSEASSKADGVAVLGVFVQVGVPGKDVIDEQLGELTNDFSKVLHYEESTETKPFPVEALIPANRTYYRYFGSLTTPACAQSVTWTVFQQPIFITEEQMSRFREIHSEFNDALMEHNNRPTQPLNGRVVFTSPVIVSTTPQALNTSRRRK